MARDLLSTSLIVTSEASWDTWEIQIGVFPAVTSNPVLWFHLDVFHPLTFQLRFL